MIYSYSATLSGAENGLEDAAIKIKNFNSRQKERAVLSVVCPLSEAEKIVDRPDGVLSVSLLADGGLVSVIDYGHIVSVVTDYGVDTGAVRLRCERNGSWDESETPVDLSGRVMYRAQNATGGLWTYRIAGPMPAISPGSDAVYGSHEFTVGQRVWIFDGNNTTIHLEEAGASLSDGPGDEDLIIDVSLPTSVSWTLGANDGPIIRDVDYYINISFELLSAGTYHFYDDYAGSPDPSLYLTKGRGLTGYSSSGQPIASELIASGKEFTVSLPAGAYNVQVFDTVKISFILKADLV